MSERSVSEQQIAVSQGKGNSSRGLSFIDFSVGMVAWTVIFFGLFALIEASSFLWRPLSIFLYSVLILGTSFLSFGILVDKSEDKGKIEKQAIASLPFVFISVIALVAAYSQMSKQLYFLLWRLCC